MGGKPSVPQVCKHPINPDLYSVVTLSDSAVQRLPLEADDSPLEREQRNQNIDDFWRDHLDCLETSFAEAKNITETEFRRLEYSIKNKSGTGSGKPFCFRGIEDAKTCYLTYPTETLNCRRTIEKLQLCLNTMMQEASKKKHEEYKKNAKKVC